MNTYRIVWNDISEIGKMHRFVVTAEDEEKALTYWKHICVGLFGARFEDLFPADLLSSFLTVTFTECSISEFYNLVEANKVVFDGVEIDFEYTAYMEN